MAESVNERDMARCDGPTCGATIIWKRTARGKWTCENPDGTSHWETCPDAAKFRKKGKE